MGLKLKDPDGQVDPAEGSQVEGQVDGSQVDGQHRRPSSDSPTSSPNPELPERIRQVRCTVQKALLSNCAQSAVSARFTGICQYPDFRSSDKIWDSDAKIVDEQ